ncbi:MAG: 30S ribosomal protein S6 [Deltaproteobacteria bacterium]|nr:30S ribosomal protein S6 [Deltaproteobacteria bacterium]
MRYYETLYLINPNLADEDTIDVVTKFNDLVEKNKGVIVKVDEWGKKTLAYAVKKFDKGYYVLLSYCAEPDLITVLKREFKLDERILKYQTVKLSDSADPEALKQKSEAVREEVGEQAKEKEGEEAKENDVEEVETLSEAISEKEGENGVQ